VTSIIELRRCSNALRVPSEPELDGLTPQNGEDPFFSVLEDDSLIVEVTVKTDRLLLPLKTNQSPDDVLLVIAVNVKPTRVTIANIGY
jgi:hypothetical protein